MKKIFFIVIICFSSQWAGYGQTLCPSQPVENWSRALDVPQEYITASVTIADLQPCSVSVRLDSNELRTFTIDRNLIPSLVVGSRITVYYSIRNVLGYVRF